MSGYWEFYEEAARALSFDGSGRVSHKFTGVKSIASRGKEGDERWIEAAEEAAWPLLYQWHYLRDRRRVPDRREGLTMREREDPVFVAGLSGANRSSGVLDPGWRLVSGGPDEYLCQKGDLHLRVRAGEARRDAETVTIRFPAERRHWMPLFYCTAGGVSCEVNLRVYFNVKPACAAWLLETLSRELQQAGASYQLKLLNHPQSYTRPDAAVLYLPMPSIGVCRAVVDRLIAGGNAAFRGAVPALTRRIHAGIAVADEPPAVRGRRASFGEHRCRILARALARAHAAGGRSVTQAVEAICREFVSGNLDPSQPYKAAGGNSAAANF